MRPRSQKIALSLNSPICWKQSAFFLSELADYWTLNDFVIERDTECENLLYRSVRLINIIKTNVKCQSLYNIAFPSFNHGWTLLHISHF